MNTPQEQKRARQRLASAGVRRPSLTRRTSFSTRPKETMPCPHMVASSSVRRSGIRSVCPRQKPRENSTLWRTSPAAAAARRASSVSPLMLTERPRSLSRSSARNARTRSRSSKTAQTTVGASTPAMTSAAVSPPSRRQCTRGVRWGEGRWKPPCFALPRFTGPCFCAISRKARSLGTQPSALALVDIAKTM
ncbi:MAG TPA: hypothetical protein DCQ64_24455 [Candidatus Rokubacteria bacterium]|nr:hypothetical protein [Candidatus Rokubacteria bacterium]